MRLLVLGGTRFVGRTVVEQALAKGWQVSALNRGITGSPATGAELIVADRTRTADVRNAIAGRTWDLVIDTWSGAPAVATDTAAALAGRTGRFGYVSSGSVYRWGEHVNEDSPVVDAEADAHSGDYASAKRGAELGVLRAFPDALLARAGLILGPYEDVGRLPWWLGRVSRGGRVVAPGRPDRPLQFIDARDLAVWLLEALVAGRSGPFDVISASGHATTEDLLAACRTVTGSSAEFVWVGEDRLSESGAEPWTQLPCWVPEAGDFAGFLEVDTSRVRDSGLACRPLVDTVRATWDWLQSAGSPPARADRPEHGLPIDLEQRLLATAGEL